MPLQAFNSPGFLDSGLRRNDGLLDLFSISLASGTDVVGVIVDARLIMRVHIVALHLERALQVLVLFLSFCGSRLANEFG